MLKKRGNRKSQTISTDFIVGFTLYFLAFSIFSYYVFAVEGDIFSERSFLKDTYYSFEIFEENARNSGIKMGGENYHLFGGVEGLKALSYEDLKYVVLNGTQFENMIDAVDICVYLTDLTEQTYFHAGPGSKNITLGEAIPCGGIPIPTGVPPFPDCSDIYDEGFSATKLYFYNQTKRTARLVVHFCIK